MLFDAMGPVVFASAPSVDTNQSSITITVEYTDQDGIDPNTIGTGDILVTGPNGFSSVPTFVSVDAFNSGAEAQFTLTGPNGMFTHAAEGQYTISSPAGAVTDTLGNPSVENDTAGTVQVGIPLSIVSATGPITQVNVGDGLSYQVKNAQFQSGQFFAPNDALGNAGFLVRVQDPNFPSSSTVYGVEGIPLTPVSQTLSADGLSITAVANAGTTLQLTTVTSYQPGDQFFRVRTTVANLTGSPVNFALFFAADLYLAESDRGVGFFNPNTMSIGGTDRSGQYNIFFQADTTVGPQISHYEEGYYGDVFSDATDSDSDLKDTVHLPSTTPPYDVSLDPSYEDNGAGIEWSGQTVAGGGSATFGMFAAFGDITVAGQSGSVSGTLGAVTPPQYGDLSVTVPVTYTGTSGVNTTSLGNDDITVTGPGGFSTNATFVGVTNTSSGTVALYSVAGPAGGFLDTNAGTYTVLLNGGAVTAVGGGVSSATTLGSFSSSPVKPRIGGPDPTFGVNGVVSSTVSGATLTTLDSYRDADGTILSGAYDATSGSLLLTKFLANGQTDTTFGSGGVIRSPLPSNFTPRRVQFDSVSNHIYLLGTATDTGQPEVASYNLDGSPQGDFGTGGTLAIAPLQPGDRLDAFVADPDKVGGYLAGGALMRSGSTSAVIVRVDAGGQLNTKFGTKGYYQRAAGGPLDTIGSIAFGAKGAIFAAGTTSSGSVADNSVTSSVLVVALTSAGKVSKGFGGGEVTVATPGFAVASGQKAIAQSDGKVVVIAALAADATQAAAGNFGGGLIRLTAKGAPDTSVGDGGFTVVKAPASASAVSVRRVGTLATPTLGGQAGSAADVLTAPVTVVQVQTDPSGGKVRQIAADDAGADTTLTQTQLVTDALDLQVTGLMVSNKKPYKFKAKVASSVGVSNVGTLASPSSVPVQIYQSVDPTLETARDTLLPETSAKVSLVPGKSKTIKISFVAPDTAGTYYYFARLDVGNGAATEISLGNNLAEPSGSIVVTATGKPAAAAIAHLAASASAVPILDLAGLDRRDLFSSEAATVV